MHRIVANGYEFKIQKSEITFWRRREIWKDCLCHLCFRHGYVVGTTAEAEQLMGEHLLEEARDGEWHTVGGDGGTNKRKFLDGDQ